ncbi:unnamed protein product [Arabis nemorensis]|uniref:Uncharacterized protein n=1 Tax=Arabis nemorensis TaxID=586526 RepID=A0A565C6Y6_9BRAS|nr:unnamed protein product [Arabis nemorensis]
MDFSLHPNNENLVISNNQPFLSDDDVSNFQNGYLNSFDDASLNGLYHPPIPAAFSHHHHQNLISSIPYHYYSSLNLNVETTQVPPNYEAPTTNIPSTYPLMDINSFKEIQQNENIVRDEIVHDHGFITGGGETNLDQKAQSQPFDFAGPNNISGTNKKFTNQSQDQVVKNIPSKKANIIKWKWTRTEDKQDTKANGGTLWNKKMVKDFKDV